MRHTIGIAEMAVSTSPEDVLITYSLGSCVGLTLYDPEVCVGGMIHCMLPLSQADTNRSKDRPFMFVDTGVAQLIQAVLNLGAEKRRLIARAAGASQIMDDKGMFKIGERNYTVLRKILWKNNILIKAEDVGGCVARTMLLHMDDGRTIIKSNGAEKELI